MFTLAAAHRRRQRKPTVPSTPTQCDRYGIHPGHTYSYSYSHATPTPTPTPTMSPCVQYVTSTGTGAIVPGTTDTGNHCDDCATAITLPFPVTVYGRPITLRTSPLTAIWTLWALKLPSPMAVRSCRVRVLTRPFCRSRTTCARTQVGGLHGIPRRRLRRFHLGHGHRA